MLATKKTQSKNWVVRTERSRPSEIGFQGPESLCRFFFLVLFQKRDNRLLKTHKIVKVSLQNSYDDFRINGVVVVDHNIPELCHFLQFGKEDCGQHPVFMKYFERVRIARGRSEGLVRNDMACNINARLDHHLQGSFDDALRFP